MSSDAVFLELVADRAAREPDEASGLTHVATARPKCLQNRGPLQLWQGPAEVDGLPHAGAGIAGRVPVLEHGLHDADTQLGRLTHGGTVLHDRLQLLNVPGPVVLVQ